MKINKSAIALALFTCSLVGIFGTSASAQGNKETVVYDSFDKPGGYTLADYQAKWANNFGPGEMAINDTRSFTGGKFLVSAVPFQTAYDFSVYDHIKYIATSKQSFPVPAKGSVTFSTQVTAETPGTIPNLVVHGTYTQSGAPYEATVAEGQQAGVVMNMIDFNTGQLFDWFVTGSTAFTLIERLPSSVSGSTAFVGRDKMYTQIIREIPLGPGQHTISITYTRRPNKAIVEYFLDGRSISKVDNVGIPLDKQGVNFTGTYPSLGPGEELKDKINSLTIGHGLFSLLDAFPFQHPDAPELSVSIPVANRIFGQGASAQFGPFVVTTKKD